MSLLAYLAPLARLPTPRSVARDVWPEQDDVRAPSGVTGTGTTFLIDANDDNGWSDVWKRPQPI